MNARSDTPLGIRQANRIAAGRVHVSTDTIDPTLWRVEDEDACEAHEPMTASEWLAFLNDWAA